MASHSEHGAVIRGLSQTLGVSQGPVDTSMARDAVINGARHLHDECAQSLIKLAAPAGSYWTQASPSSSTFQLLDLFPPAEFPVHKRSDTGLSFLVLCLARVSISTAGTATFRVAIHPGGAEFVDARFPPIYGAGFPTVAEFTTTNTTGETVAVAALSFTTVQLHAARVLFPSKRGDGSLGAGVNFVGALSVWAKASAGAPRLHSISAREYVGA